MNRSEEKAISAAIFSVAALSLLLSMVFTIAWVEAGHYETRLRELEAKVKSLEKR